MFVTLNDSRFADQTIEQTIAHLEARVADLFSRAAVTPEEVLPGGAKRSHRLNGIKWGMLPLAEAAANLHHLKIAAASAHPLFIDDGKGGFWAQPGTRERLAGHDTLCARECDAAEKVISA